RLPRQLFDVEQLRELAERARELLVWQRVDLAVELEAVAGRQVPPELIFLPHDQRELPPEGVVPLPGDKAEHAGRAGGGIDQSREHLQRRSLAGPVWTEKSDHRAG